MSSFLSKNAALRGLLDQHLSDLAAADDVLFTDFLDKWLKGIKGIIKPSTWESYDKTVSGKIKPYFELTRKIAAVLPEKATKIVTLEEEIRAGGFGMMLLDALSEFDVMSNKKTKILATSDSFCIPEKGQTCYEASGVDRNSIVKAFE